MGGGGVTITIRGSYSGVSDSEDRPSRADKEEFVKFVADELTARKRSN
ncbi:hypothetical protein [Dyadobacter bucti]